MELLCTLSVVALILFFVYQIFRQFKPGPAAEEKPTSTRRGAPLNCPACEEKLLPTRLTCPACGLDSRGKIAKELVQLRTTLQQVGKLAEATLLDDATVGKLQAAVAQRREQLLPTLAAVVEPVVITTVVPDVAPEPAAMVVAPLSEPVSEKPVEVAPPAPLAPPRRWTDVLAGFMEEKNILWGEIVGGLLIVGCSVALVLSLWQRLEAIPYFPFVVFSAVSLALFGAGQYTLHRWRLESTSRGLLVITLFLLPLNLLMLAGLAKGREGGAVEIAVSGAALLLFAWVARKGGATVAPGDGWTIPLAVVGASTTPLLLPWLAPYAGSWLPATLAVVAAGCFAAAVTARLKTLTEGSPLTKERAHPLFLTLCLAVFTVGVAIVFLTLQAEEPALTVRQLGMPLAMVAMPLFVAGLMLQRRLTGAEDGLRRAGATSAALTGVLVAVASLMFSWRDPLLLLSVGLLLAAVLGVLAVRLKLAWAHGVALPCLGLAAVTGLPLISGDLGLWDVPLRKVLAAQLGGDNGVVLAVGAVLLAVGALRLRGRDGLAVVMGAIGFALAALLLVSWHAATDAGRGAFVYGLLGGVMLLAVRHWRSQIPAVIGYLLLVAASVWLLAWLEPAAPVWGLTVAAESLLLAVLAMRHIPLRDRASVAWLVTAPCHWLALIAAGLSLSFGATEFAFEPAAWELSLVPLLLATALALRTWARRQPGGVYVSAVLLWMSVAHVLIFVVPIGTMAEGITTGSLGLASVLLMLFLRLRAHDVGHRVRAVFARPVRESVWAISVVGLLALFAMLAGELFWGAGWHLVWLGALWLAMAWLHRSPGWMTAAQLAISTAVIVLTLAGLNERLDEVWELRHLGLEWFGAALSMLGLGWVAARWLLRRSPTARILFSPPWPAVDRILLGVLTVAFFEFCVSSVVPAVMQELFGGPASMSAFAEVGLWVFGAALVVYLAAALGDRDREYEFVGLIVAALALPYALAVAPNNAVPLLRWLLGGMAILASAPIWLRGRFTLAPWSYDLARYLVLGLSLTALTLLGLPFNPDVESSLDVAGPLGLLCLAFIGHAVRERSSVLALLGGFVVNLTVSLAFWPQLWELTDQDFLIRWLQVNLSASACYSLLWLVFQRHVRANAEPVPREIGLFGVQTSLGAFGTALLLCLPVIALINNPGQVMVPAIVSIAEPAGWLAWAAALLASWWFARCWLPSVVPHVLGAGGLAFGALFATTAGLLDIAHPWVILIFVWALLAGIWAWVFVRESLGGRPENVARGWVDGMSALLAVMGIAGAATAPLLPWTSAGPVLLASALAGAIAILKRSPVHVPLSGFGLVLAAMFGWNQWGDETSFGWILFLVSACATSSLLWAILTRRFGLSATFSLNIALGGIILLCYFIPGSLLVSTSPPPLAWIALLLTSAALAAHLWHETTHTSLPLLYIVGLLTAVLILAQTGFAGERMISAGTLLLAGQFLICTALCHLARRWAAWSEKWNMAPWVSQGPVQPWWTYAQCGVGGTALLLGFGLTCGALSWVERLAGAMAVMLIVWGSFSFTGTLERRDQVAARHVRLLLVPMGLAAWCFVSLAPVEVGGGVHHVAVGLFVTTVVCLVYWEGGRRLPHWGKEVSLVGAALGIVALVLVPALLVLEMRTFSLVSRRTPLASLEVVMAALALAGLLAMALREALRGRGEIGVAIKGRTWFVYAAEVLAVLLFAHLRLNIPAMRQATQATVGPYWPFLVMGVAYVGAALGELFRRRGLEVLAEPLHRTGLLLPLLPLLAFWLRPSPEVFEEAGRIAPGLAALLSPLQHVPEQYSTYASFWFLTAGLLLGVAAVRQSFVYSVAGALAANVGLWMLLTHHGLALWLHPQLWLVPPALFILLAEQINRGQLSREQRLGLRYVGLALLYLSSTADLFLHGVGESVVLPLGLAVFSLMGILAGILLRVRAFLFVGLLFLLIDVLSMIWHAAVERTQTWVWYVSGIVLGGAILALFAVFEKRREDVLRLIEDVKKWD